MRRERAEAEAILRDGRLSDGVTGATGATLGRGRAAAVEQMNEFIHSSGFG